ncbi:hypothetical protein CcI49_14490 [Frankia sp. CcI49]|uniref:serine/threonine-protein kinase n=1 Tax=Frankia sp. CcI49 TaxID=1745382 RepID=UPI0009754799|nr:tetratricopeptide repeat protein [Frankia sp. CcI49]ONH59920.1 hypothetical protein CcI49_14490 [Frankia sp. CcI49]
MADGPVGSAAGRAAARSRWCAVIYDREQVARALPDYVLGEHLGSGTFGAVLAAQHREMDRPVAVKVLPAKTLRGNTTDEAKLLGQLDHPHVVRVHDARRTDDLCLVVMELLPGGTLTQRQVGFGPTQVCAVGLAVAAALAYIHRPGGQAQGLLHRDIKPDNILFAADGTPKVGDFGIAKLFDGSGAAASGLAGTPAYMAPEQFNGDRLSPATDLYALATVLYQALAGRAPYDGSKEWGLLRYQKRKDPPPPLDDVPAPVATVIMRTLARSPADRYASAAEFSLALARAGAEAFGPGWLTRVGHPLHLDDAVRATAGSGVPGGTATDTAGQRTIVTHGGPRRHPEPRGPRTSQPGGTRTSQPGGTRTSQQRTRHDDHPEVLAAAHSDASELSDVGDHEAARTLDEDTLARRLRVLGPDHRDTLATAHNLAADLAALGDHRGARDLYLDTFARRRAILGPADAGTLTTAFNLAVVLSALDEHEHARDLGEETLRLRRGTLGPDHADTLAAAFNLAVYLGRLGRYQEARTIGENVWADRCRLLGAGHPDVLRTAAALQWWIHQDQAAAPEQAAAPAP